MSDASRKAPVRTYARHPQSSLRVFRSRTSSHKRVRPFFILDRASTHNTQMHSLWKSTKHFFRQA